MTLELLLQFFTKNQALNHFQSDVNVTQAMKCIKLLTNFILIIWLINLTLSTSPTYIPLVQPRTWISMSHVTDLSWVKETLCKRMQDMELYTIEVRQSKPVDIFKRELYKYLNE